MNPSRLLATCVACVIGCSSTNANEQAGASSEAPKPGSSESTNPSSTSTADADPLLIHTDRGDVRGQSVSDAIALFRDVPYAAPPVGDLRWKPPAPHEPWSGEVGASKFPKGIACYPTVPPSMGAAGNPGESEDCLYLDVYAPKTKPAGPLPVVFYLHGGFHLWGKKGDVDGTALAEFANVVVVSANYRLGALGFLAHPALTDEQGSSGNYAHLDQLAALQWVKNNIAKFGGDPDRVTLSGQSAGGQSTCVLYASPLGAGLFARAIDISGAGCVTWDRDTAYRGGETLAKNVGCADAVDVLQCMRKSSLSKATTALPIDSWSLNYRWRAVVDGNVLPKKAQALINDGAQNRVPFVIGTTSREAVAMLDTFFAPVGSKHAPAKWTADDYAEAVHATYGDIADDVLAMYPVSNYQASSDGTAATEAMIALLTDDRFACPARRVARAAAGHQTEPVYRYLFDLGGAMAAKFGNGHAIDLKFDFHVADRGLPKGALLDTVHVTQDAAAGFFGAFAANGAPNAFGSITWPRYTSAKDEVLVFDDPVRIESGVRSTECDFWDAHTQDP